MSLCVESDWYVPHRSKERGCPEVWQVSPMGWVAQSITLQDRLSKLQALLETGVSTVVFGPPGMLEASELTQVGQWLRSREGKPGKLVVPLVDSDQCSSLVQAGITDVVVEVACGEDFKTQLASTTKLTSAAVGAGLEVRANIANAFDGEGENFNLSMVTDAVMALADSGAYTIVLADTLGKADEDTFREAVEEAFYQDVVGDTMLERLGVRAIGPLCQNAARLGVQHFDSWAGSESPPASVVWTSELAYLLTEEDKAHKLRKLGSNIYE